MTNNPRVDVVAQQYQNWQYPEPIHDLEAWLVNNWQWYDPQHAHRLFWPDHDYRAGLDILIAGCGTNQAAVIAFTNPSAKVVAIDVSQPSLNHHRLLKDKYRLDNLELHCLPIEEVATLNRSFDLVISTGVLHHLADPKVGLKALAEQLRPDGVAAIMVYASYGRVGVEMLKGVFQDMGLRQDEASLVVLKSAIQSLPSDHPVQRYMAMAPDLQFDAGLVDTFLHGRDRNFTVADCLDLVDASGLVFQDWFLKSPYYPDTAREDPFLSAVARLPIKEQWGLMERINHCNACHFFTACKPERAKETYRIDFSTDQWLDAVPEFRYRCSLEGTAITRPGWSCELAPRQLAFLRLVNGRRKIREIVASIAGSGDLRNLSHSELQTVARSVFQTFWQSDFLAMRLGATNAEVIKASPPARADQSLEQALQPIHPAAPINQQAINDSLRPALVNRLLRRAVANGSIRLPAVPAMIDDYQTLCDRTFASLGIEFSHEQRAQLRQVLTDQLEVAWAASPRSEIVITYESPIGLTVSYEIKPEWLSLGAAYDNWVSNREPPYFGVLPDARLWVLACESTDPSTAPILDIGAGTGRNAMAFARRGHPVDAVELSGKFAQILQADAAKDSLDVRVIQRDVLSASDDLRNDYALVVASEVASDFRSTADLRRLFELAAERLVVGGRLAFNVFLAREGYQPDAAARELGQQVYTSIFARSELASAASGLPLELVSDESVFDYEKEHLPQGAWPPTGWYANWVSGLDVFDVTREGSPIEMQWLVYAKHA